MVKSVVLAWGSSVWDPRDLKIASEFAANGPLLPIEFCRISEDGRLTLAIDETFGALCKTYSAPSALEGLDAARYNLCLREGMADARAIGFVEPASGRQSDLAMQSHPQVVATVGAWAELPLRRRDLDCAHQQLRCVGQGRRAVLRLRGAAISGNTGG